MNSNSGKFFCVLFLVGSVLDSRGAETVWLDELELSSMQQGWGKPQAKLSVSKKPLSLLGQKFERGVGTHAMGTYHVSVNGAERFQATVGLDDSANGPGSVVFQVLADRKKVFDSGVMRSNTPPKEVDVDLHGVKLLTLKVTDAGDGGTFDHADWANARFVVNGDKPAAFVPKPEPAYVLTPKPGPAPRLNGPKIYGARPGNPFLHRIPAQGERPMIFTAENLPTGLKLDAEKGILSGTTPPRGEYRVVLHAKNSRGTDQREFKIVSGDKLSLTPSMGFNDWYAYYDNVSDKLMREAADTMVRSGMADVGYEYVNIDDCWMNAEKNKDPLRNGPFRDARGELLPNKYFPDMMGLADYIHAKGLKAGLYTSPGRKTCAGFAGAYGHEAQDAKLFADWGFDFLKYDWCSYNVIASNPPSLAQMKQPYVLMGDLLKQQRRDFVFNLCQYGMGDVWQWGAEVGGHSWRTSGDLGNELNNIFGVALKNCEHRDWQKPGAWNDPDYVQIGFIGSSKGPVPCPLTPTEQYSFMSLWCLMASPLFYSGDMTQLDEFTLNVLCNPEVIEVDQDPLGECARVIRLDDDRFIMVKQLADGSVAVGLANQGETEAEVTAEWGSLDLAGKHQVRDLWRQADLGEFENHLSKTIPRHGVFLVRITTRK